MTSIVERLRNHTTEHPEKSVRDGRDHGWFSQSTSEAEEAANEIERLTAEVTELRQVLGHSLSSFNCTQRPSDYAAAHWSNRAIRLLSPGSATDSGSQPPNIHVGRYHHPDCNY